MIPSQVAAAVQHHWWLFLLRGVAALAFGVLTLAWPGATLLVLMAFIAAYALVDGIVALVYAFRLRPMFDRWWMLLIRPDQRRLRRPGVHLSEPVAGVHRGIGVAVDADCEHRAVPAGASPEGDGCRAGLERARRVPHPGARCGLGTLPATDGDDRARADRVVRAGGRSGTPRGGVPRPVARAGAHDRLRANTARLSRHGTPDSIRAVTIRLVVLLTFSMLAGCRASATSG